MPTAAELTILLEAQNNASAQLRQVGQDVQRLEQQVEGVRRTSARGGGLFSGLSGGLGFAASIAGFQGAANTVKSLFDGIGESIFGMNSRLEQQRGTLRALTGSAEEAERILDQLRREADITPFDTQEMLAAGAALTAVARTARVDVMDMVRTAEILAAFRPEQGLEGAARALSEAMEGNLQSITERFGVTTAAIQRFRAQGMSTFEAVNAAMREMGLNSRIIQELANTFPGLTSNVVSFFNEIRRRLGEGVFLRVEEGLKAVTRAIATNGEAVYQWASRVGSVIGALVNRVGSQLGELAVHILNMVQPGLGEEARRLFSQIAADVDKVGETTDDATPKVQALDAALSLPQARQGLQDAGRNLNTLNTLAARTGAPVAQIARELGAIGVQAAEIQIGADRIRRGYEDQIRPLERQLDLLQNSIELQRIQAGLASNRSQVERLRLDREIAALEQAAGGATDPTAPNLTPRQRAIALALEERNLRREELGIQQQQAPAVQAIQQRLTELRREQADALRPSEELLKNYQDRVAVLNVERQRWENLKGDIQAAVDFANANPIQAKTAPPDSGEQAKRQAEYREAGEKLADQFLLGWQTWLDTRTTAAWNLVTASYWKWWAAGGASQVAQMGDELGGTLARFAVAAFESRFGEAVGRTLVDVLTPAPTLPPPGTLPPGLPPTVSIPIPEVLRGPGPETNITINVAEALGVGTLPGFQDRLQAAFAEFWRNFISTEAATDPGASGRLQGAGGTP